jgi:hypothetical protein
MKHLVRYALGGVWLVTCTAMGHVALASPPSDAAPSSATPGGDDAQIRDLMNEAAGKFAQGDWEGARLAYLRAWESRQHPAIAANMAAAEMKLGRYLQAAEHLEFALHHLPSGKSEKREAVQAQLSECRSHIAALTIIVTVDGAEIHVDQRSIGRSPFSEPVFLEPGHHSIEAIRPGFVTETKQIEAVAGGHVDVLFELHEVPSVWLHADVPKPAAPEPVSSRAAHEGHWRNLAIVGGAAATAVSLTVGIVFRVKSNDAEEERVTLQSEVENGSPAWSVAARSECAGQSPSATCNSLRNKVDEYDRQRNISTAAFVTSGALGLSTIALAIFWPSAHSQRQPNVTHARLIPRATRNGSELMATFDF